MSDDPRKAIVGTWRLVHSVEYGSGGTPHYPFGQDALERLVVSGAPISTLDL